MPTDKQQDMGSGDPKQNTGGFGTSRNSPAGSRGGEHGEKRPTNADHDEKIARNRANMLSEEEEIHSRSAEHASHGSETGGGRSADDVLGQTAGRKSKDQDRERKSGDIVSGTEHSQFPSSQAGYDDRTEDERPSPQGNKDMQGRDKDQNDDLSHLDREEDGPLK